MKFCYLIMTHQNAAQIARLVRTLLASSRDGWILLLHDRKGCSLEGVPFLSDPRVELIMAPFDIIRGDYSQVEAYLHALDWLQQSQRPWDWVVHISGQDYPVRPLWETEELLAISPFDAYLHHWEMGAPNDEWRPQQGRIRYHYQYRRLPQWTSPILRAFKWTHSLQTRWRVFRTYGAQLGSRARKLPFGPDLRVHGGSSWHNLRRECAEYLLAFRRERPDVVAHYRRCIAPDESFVHTALVNSGRFRICNDNRRYIDWTGVRDGRPKVLTSADLSAMCTGAHDFARKFDPAIDARVLDLLDERVARAPLRAHAR